MKLLHVHVPWRHINERLPELQHRGLQPELAFTGPDLDSLDPAQLDRVADCLQTAGLAVTIHAPFLDLNPGALDPLVREVTWTRLSRTLELATTLQARVVVVHPGFDLWHYDHKPQLWLNQALPFFRELLALAEASGTRLAVENIFETRIDSLVELVTGLDHPLCGYCFDVGHWNLFAESTDMAAWLAEIADRLFHLHLHDNCGRTDQHLPLGAGTIDFAPLNALLSQIRQPPTMTLEAHTSDNLFASLAALTQVLPAVG